MIKEREMGDYDYTWVKPGNPGSAWYSQTNDIRYEIVKITIPQTPWGGLPLFTDLKESLPEYIVFFDNYIKPEDVKKVEEFVKVRILFVFWETLKIYYPDRFRIKVVAHKEFGAQLYLKYVTFSVSRIMEFEGAG